MKVLERRNTMFERTKGKKINKIGPGLKAYVDGLHHALCRSNPRIVMLLHLNAICDVYKFRRHETGAVIPISSIIYIPRSFERTI